MALFEFLEKCQIKSIEKKIDRLRDKKYSPLVNSENKINISLLSDKVKTDKGCITKSAEVDYFQKELREERLLEQNRIRLVAFDVSKTLIEYVSTPEQKLYAANLIYEKMTSLGYDVTSPSEIVIAIESGIKSYSDERNQTGIERPELDVYKEFVIPAFCSQPLNEKCINEIIVLWRQKSVSTHLNTTRIREFITDLKRRKVAVVTVSDMLGDMSFEALRKHNLYSLFDAHFCSNNFGVRKNNKTKSLFSCVVDVMQIHSENCLMIGNDIEDDIKPSSQLGFYTIYTGFDSKITSDVSLLSVNSVDEVYECYTKNLIPGLPYMCLTPFTERVTAKRVDSKLNQLYYQLRMYAKRIPNRNLRTQIYKEYLLSHVGNSTRIGNNFEVRYPENIFIGENCQIGDDITILNEGVVIIGNNVMIARNVFVSTFYHNWRLGMVQDSTDSWAKGNTVVGTVSIESNVWIGPSCIFEADVFIGHHSVIAANSFVQSGVYPPYSLIAGCPAVIKKDVSIELENIKKSFVLE